VIAIAVRLKPLDCAFSDGAGLGNTLMFETSMLLY
jgi:hypothetical protein